jgi:hypothetical protein
LPSRHSRENASALPPCAALSTVSNSSPITWASIGSPATRPQRFGHLGPSTPVRPAGRPPSTAPDAHPAPDNDPDSPKRKGTGESNFPNHTRSAWRPAQAPPPEPVLFPPRPTAPVRQDAATSSGPAPAPSTGSSAGPVTGSGPARYQQQDSHEGTWQTTGSGGSGLGPRRARDLCDRAAGPGRRRKSGPRHVVVRCETALGCRPTGYQPRHERGA